MTPQWVPRARNCNDKNHIIITYIRIWKSRLLPFKQINQYDWESQSTVQHASVPLCVSDPESGYWLIVLHISIRTFSSIIIPCCSGARTDPSATNIWHWMLLSCHKGINVKHIMNESVASLCHKASCQSHLCMYSQTASGILGLDGGQI